MAAKFRPCAESGCNANSHHTAGGKRQRCSRHYLKWKEVNAERRCSVDGCDKPHFGKGYCGAHWRRVAKNGDLALRRNPNGIANEYVETIALTHSSDECLAWPFTTNGVGYGTLTVDGARTYAHRYVCERANGSAPSTAHLALHSCGNGHLGCVNPRHLRWGLHVDNVEDSRDHDTIARGTRHGMVRLTEDQVIEIRAMQGTCSLSSIAEKFGVSRSLISMIHQRKRWAHL